MEIRYFYVTALTFEMGKNVLLKRSCYKNIIDIGNSSLLNYRTAPIPSKRCQKLLVIRRAGNFSLKDYQICIYSHTLYIQWVCENQQRQN